jgi:hypothetical protein
MVETSQEFTVMARVIAAGKDSTENALSGQPARRATNLIETGVIRYIWRRKNTGHLTNEIVKHSKQKKDH